MSISPTLFLERMENRWAGFGNVVSAPLRRSWHQTCTALNDKHRAADDPWEEETWKVLCPPTGSGKTQGLIVYASMLNTQNIPLYSHPGMIIVTRRIDDADNIAQQINELSRAYSGDPKKPDTAISYHSDKKGLVKMSELAQHPELVITHNAYSRALDELNRNAEIEDTWDYFYNFKSGRRKLVVIDEAIDLVEYTEIQLEDIKAVLFLCEPIKKEFPSEWEMLCRLKGILEQYAEDNKRPHKESILNDLPTCQWFFNNENSGSRTVNGIPLDSLSCLDLTEFKKALRKIKMDRLIKKHDAGENARLVRNCLETVSAVNSLLKTFIFYSRNQSTPTFNAARYIVPPDARGGVILDATAMCNPVYDLCKGASVIKPPTGTRNYQNVTVHTSYGHKVGNSEMGDNKKALQLSQDLVDHLDVQFSKDTEQRKVLVITHDDVEPFLKQCIPQNFNMSVAHWGALDGSNEWNDHDTVVIFGLPYKPKRWSASVFMGYQGMQSTAWLQDKNLRKFKKHEDIRIAIDDGQMITDIVQAVNRVRCRKVTDEDGNCPKTDVFMLLPTENKAKTLLDGISREMPGIRITGWNYDSQKQKKRGRKSGRGNWDESLVAYLKKLGVGDRIAASDISKALDINSETWKDIVRRIKTPGTYLNEELKRITVGYQMELQRAAFLKLAP
ncbi:DEAD/DEAH box helicase family protein [Pelobacter propionicus]|uniref:Helicase/UvrB N-terminal domain-containing protein n=1 Tax=Pelobacter propionicus (strain DSM 2379 / NBRC 103807 / OttBd1) TaxID=338966 RepID=A1ANM6_PELPD|nr:DEAD/DEAH box helicase family protein [Pelobacter propionicus]ABK98946.1 hypothetical protein Ppro_1326 [Pelobacter propionicus DSM 2379]